MKIKIDTPTARSRLKERNEPYWQQVAPGCYLGLRVGRNSNIWKARKRLDTGKQKYETLGTDTELDFNQALAAAGKWFGTTDAETVGRYTVKDCAKDYIKHLELNNGVESAHRTEQQFKKHLVPVLGKVAVSKLTTRQIEQWRNNLVDTSRDGDALRASKDSANRNLSQFKAALNRAFNSGTVASDKAWRRVKPFPKVGAARKLLNRAWLAKC